VKRLGRVKNFLYFAVDAIRIVAAQLVKPPHHSDRASPIVGAHALHECGDFAKLGRVGCAVHRLAPATAPKARIRFARMREATASSAQATENVTGDGVALLPCGCA
jgi:hypothetical protein